jgi:hypothetical protein
VVSLHSSERWAFRPGTSLPIALFALVALLGAGCVTVRPQDKEFLADPAMAYGSGGEETAQEAHVLSNREGSIPSSASGGGGCGCN